jgi:AcrR family transcriptional regulator
MKLKRENAREAILESTIRLLDEVEDCSRLSIRTIAKNAGVSTGIPNYYFGSKVNLIKEAVYRKGEIWLKWWFEFSRSLEGPPEQKIRLFCRTLGNYYAENPNITKILLNNDIFVEFKDTIRMRFNHEISLPLSKEISPYKSDEDIMLVVFIISDSFDLTFLRAISKHPDISFDYFDKTSRDKFIDRLVDYNLLLLRS